MNKDKCLRLVIEQIENMLYNNKEDMNNISENFVDWCEGGIVFYLRKNIVGKNRITEKEYSQCLKYMYEIAPLVDNMTNKLYGLSKGE